jgi:PRC-barrel domain
MENTVRTTNRTTTDLWTYDDSALGVSVDKANVIGYEVEALDGSIGKVDDATYDAGAAYIVVDTGPWIFGKKVLLPAGTIQRADHENEKVFVNRTKDQIKDAPEYEETIGYDPTYRGRLSSYYDRGGPGWRDWD